MLLKIKDYSLQFEQPAHIIEHLSAKGGRRFVDDVMEEYAVVLLANQDVDNIIREGVWRIQELAYIPILEQKRPKKRQGKKPLPLPIRWDAAGGMEARRVIFDDIDQLEMAPRGRNR